MSTNENEVYLEKDGDVLYKSNKKNGQHEFTPGLPHDKLMQELLNNKQIVISSPHITQKVLNMEWKWFERRIIKWLGDNEYSRNLQNAIREHIKNEKKWVLKGAKMSEAKNYIK